MSQRLASAGPHTQFERATEYELMRVLENARDSQTLTAALRERDARLPRRCQTRDFWSDAFYQETRRLRDNVGGDFVTVPAGSYLVGDHQRIYRQVRRVETQRPFAIGRFPVTESDFRRFLDDGGYQRQALWDAPGWTWREELALDGPWLWQRYPYSPERARLPMTGLCYFEAIAYCQWYSATNPHRPVRLASGVEWEIAARGRLGRPYPWGWRPDATRANVGDEFNARLPVNSSPGGVSPFGCWDMVGNAREITATPWGDDAKLDGLRARLRALPRDPLVGLHVGVWSLCKASKQLRMRGGSHRLGWVQARVPHAVYMRPDERVVDLGMRLVTESTPDDL